MRRLLITGGAGFIGSNFVRYWLKQYPGDRLVVLDALTYAGHLSNLEDVMHRGELRFVHGDIRNTDLAAALLRDERLDTVVHFAAESHVDRSIAGPDAFMETNVLGTHSLLKAARRVWLDERNVTSHRFHHVSTDEVYGSLRADEPEFTETRSYAPNSPYAASKAASDHLVRAYHHTYGLDVSTSHCSNNYGPYHFPEKLVPLTIVNILLGIPVPVYGDGRNVRDWLHVDDHCRGIDRIIAGGGSGEVYNIGGDSQCENIQLVQTVCDLIDAAWQNGRLSADCWPNSPPVSGKPAASLLTYVADRPGHDRRYAIDCGKIQRILSYRPTIKLNDGLRDTVAWYLTNQIWWRAALNRQWTVAPNS